MYFSMFYNLDEEILDEYGAFNISLINDMPLFIDPFLLFNSEKEKYQNLHEKILDYLAFLREQSSSDLNESLIESWYKFPEIKQNWLGYSMTGNSGSGLGSKFAHALNTNLTTIFTNFGSETITESSHLEKLCLIKSGVGKDNISDFTTNLIFEYLLEYTENFTLRYIDKSKQTVFRIPKVYFNYKTRSWVTKSYKLPRFNNDFIILTPKDILTKDDTWINRNDMIAKYHDICSAMDNSVLRAQMNDYLERSLRKDMSKKEEKEVYARAISHFPEYIDHFIKYKELNGEEAEDISSQNVTYIQSLLINNVGKIVSLLKEKTDFDSTGYSSYDESMSRIKYLKRVIENNDGYLLFYHEGKPINQEKQLQLVFKFVWHNSEFDINREVNNGRGPVDYKVTKSFCDTTLIEFKLAKNTKLKQNLLKQVEIYEQANDTKSSIKVIIYFSEDEMNRVIKILEDIEQLDNENIILIDARADNKQSASTVKV